MDTTIQITLDAETQAELLRLGTAVNAPLGVVARFALRAGMAAARTHFAGQLTREACQYPDLDKETK